MAIFEYKHEIRGKVIQQEIKADSLQLAKIKLKSKNIDPIYIHKKAALPFFAGGKGLKTKELLFFTRQISFLLDSGVSILQALHICMDMTKDPKLNGIIKEISLSVEGGKSFSCALRAKPHIFDGFYVNMVVCAEETGMLDKILSDLSDYIERSETIKKKVRSAMTYPILVLSISFAIIIGIIMFVVPKFEALYSGGAGGELPAITQLFVDLSHILRTNWLSFFGVMIAIPFCLMQYLRMESGKKQLQSLLKILPVFGTLQYKSGLARFCRAFYSLQSSGVDFIAALNIASNISDNEEISKGVTIAKNYVSQGKGFTQGLKVSTAFPALVTNMTGVGEESGKLDSTFKQLTEYYEKEVENLISSLIKMIEPLMIVFLGGMIGLIILALYLPVFNMGDII